MRFGGFVSPSITQKESQLPPQGLPSTGFHQGLEIDDIVLNVSQRRPRARVVSAGAPTTGALSLASQGAPAG